MQVHYEGEKHCTQVEQLTARALCLVDSKDGRSDSCDSCYCSHKGGKQEAWNYQNGNKIDHVEPITKWETRVVGSGLKIRRSATMEVHLARKLSLLRGFLYLRIPYNP